MKVYAFMIGYCISTFCAGQALLIPDNTNIPNKISKKIGVTEIEISWNAPAVRGRENQIWGTNVAWYGTLVLGYGSHLPSPWRAGADECTKISFSTDVNVNGKELQAGSYSLFIELSSDSVIVIFNSNTEAWGSYFYDKQNDVLRVASRLLKGQLQSVERLNYTINEKDKNSAAVRLEWEYKAIQFEIDWDYHSTTFDYIKQKLSTNLGFDPLSLANAANWCNENNINPEQALIWINSALSSNLGGFENFSMLNIKSELLKKLNKDIEAKEVFSRALEKGSARELNAYGRKLLSLKKYHEALEIFHANHNKFNGAWPTNTGLMRGYSAIGDFQKSLQYAKNALLQTPDEMNKTFIVTCIKKLEQGIKIDQ